MHEELNELQRDALTETINIGVGRASRALAQLMRSEVAMSVPVIIQCSPQDIRDIVTETLFESAEVCSVSRRVAGLDADVAMIFQATKETMSELLATTGIGGIAREGPDSENCVREAVAHKIGYLVIESCLDQIENVVGRSIERSALVYFNKLPAGIFSKDHSPPEPVIIVKIDISVPKRGISGHLLCSMTHKAANRMADGLDALVVESVG